MYLSNKCHEAGGFISLIFFSHRYVANIHMIQGVSFCFFTKSYAFSVGMRATTWKNEFIRISVVK